jgi:quercetin dioxygenase-like cupin family protein
MLEKILIGAVLATIAMLGGASAQQPSAMTQQTATIKRTPLQKFDVPGANYETVIGIAEIVPNVSVGRHTHPGRESGYMLEGEMVLLVDGQPEKR